MERADVDNSGRKVLVRLQQQIRHLQSKGMPAWEGPPRGVENQGPMPNLKTTTSSPELESSKDSSESISS